MQLDKQLGRRGRRGLYGAIAGVALLEVLYGCVGDENIEALVNEHIGSTAEALTSGSTPPPACGGTFNVDPLRSLAVTDKAIVDRFPLQKVMQTLVGRASVHSQTEKDVYLRWWDTQTTAASARFPEVPHCNTNAGSAFATECPRPEAAFSNPLRDPFNASTPDFIPIGLFNRFDLTPKNGAHCGEYRIVYGMRPGTFSGRDFIIFEGVLPNPNPSAGVAGCCQVAQFWAQLSADNDITSRGTKLENFYFNGLSGYAPVVQPTNYGMSSTAKGQIRTNQFMDFQNWNLREFKLQRVCTTTTTGSEDTSTTTCKLLVAPTTVKDNPHDSLFVSGTSQVFEDDFVNNQVPKLIRAGTGLVATPDNVDRISAIGMSTLPQFDTGDAPDFPANNNYPLRLGTTSPFATRVGNQLAGTGLAIPHVTQRARAQSCMGCHQHSNGQSVAPGLTWPSSLGFIHVSENLDPSTQRFPISPALSGTFLVHRKRVLEKYLADQGAGINNMPGLRANTGDSPESARGAEDPNATLGGSTTH